VIRRNATRKFSQRVSPFDEGPHELLHDRDHAFAAFVATVAAMEIQEC
jgi:hypothetical protein